MEFVQSFEEYNKIAVTNEVDSFYENLLMDQYDVIDEGLWKTLTGFDTKQEKSAAVQKFTEDLAKIEKIVLQNKDKFPQAKNWEAQKAFLFGNADQNKFKGSLQIQESPKGGIYIVYREGKTDIQKILAGLGSAAASATSNTGKANPPV